jgi:hypothetical protein
MLRFAAKPTISRIVGSSCRQIKHQKMNFFSTKNNYQNVPPNLSPFLSTKNTQRIQTRTFRRFSSEVKEVREVREVQEQQQQNQQTNLLPRCILHSLLVWLLVSFYYKGSFRIVEI